jgi:hypothetical protein
MEKEEERKKRSIEMCKVVNWWDESKCFQKAGCQVIVDDGGGFMDRISEIVSRNCKKS